MTHETAEFDLRATLTDFDNVETFLANRTNYINRELACDHKMMIEINRRESQIISQRIKDLENCEIKDGKIIEHEQIIADIITPTHMMLIDNLSEFISVTRNSCKIMHYIQNSSIVLPGMKDKVYLYHGFSKNLGNLIKIGYTKDVQRRQKDINKHMSFLGLDADFKILGFAFGEKDLVVSIERRSITELSRYRHGGEWFRNKSQVINWFEEKADTIEIEFANSAWNAASGDTVSQRKKTNLPGESIFGSLNLEMDIHEPRLANLYRLERQIRNEAKEWQQIYSSLLDEKIADSA